MDSMDYNQFERDYLMRHKGSIVPKPRLSSWGLVFGLCLWALIAIGAALVSGAHSIPAILQTIPQVVVSPLREILSFFGFTIFELLIFAGSLYRRSNRYAAWGLLIALVGALAANVGSSIYAVGENGGDTLNLIVALVLALIAPTAAFLAGEMVHGLYEAHREAMRKAYEVYEGRRRDLDSIINREFTKYQKSLDKQIPAQVVTVAPIPDASVAPNAPAFLPAQEATPAAFGHSRTPGGQEQVMKFLDANPELAQSSSRELAALVGVGHDTANKGRNAWVNQHALRQSNGHIEKIERVNDEQ